MRWVQIADCGIPGGIHRPVADDVRGVVTHNPEGAAARGPQAAATGSAPSVTAGTTTTVSAAAATAVSLPPAPTGRAPTIMSPGRRLAGRGSQHQNRSQANGAHRAESFHDGLLSGVARGVTGVIGTNLQRGARGNLSDPPRDVNEHPKCAPRNNHCQISKTRLRHIEEGRRADLSRTLLPTTFRCFDLRGEILGITGRRLCRLMAPAS
jgi:hypothetical protein